MSNSLKILAPFASDSEVSDTAADWVKLSDHDKAVYHLKLAEQLRDVDEEFVADIDQLNKLSLIRFMHVTTPCGTLVVDEISRIFSETEDFSVFK